jgi:hypothetical protein
LRSATLIWSTCCSIWLDWFTEIEALAGVKSWSPNVPATVMEKVSSIGRAAARLAETTVSPATASSRAAKLTAR